MVTQWFPPEPAALAENLVAALGRQGWSVSVLTGIPNYPDGKVHEGFRAHQFSTETRNGIRVRRTALYPSHSASSLGRMMNYVSWAISATIGGVGELKRSDVALVYSSPATAALPAMVARLAFRRPYVLMIQDLWPDSVFASGFLTRGFVSWLARRVLGAFTDLSYRLASGVTVISPGMEQRLVERGVAPEKIRLIYNWVDESVYHPAEPDASLRADLGIAPDDFVLMYAGNHGAAQDLSTVVRAVGIADTTRPVHLVLVGDGVEKRSLERLAANEGAGRVHFLPPQGLEKMASLMAAADMQVVSLRNDPLFHITMPSKIQSILASGRPILVCASGDAARVVEEAGAGFWSAPADPRPLVRVIERATRCTAHELSSKGHNARRYYLDRMAESIGARALSDLLDAGAQTEIRRPSLMTTPTEPSPRY